MPLEHQRILDVEEPAVWVNAHFSDDPQVDGRYLPETLFPVTLPGGEEGVSFLTREQGATYRYLVVRDAADTLSAFRTPVSDANPDGNTVFADTLGVDLRLRATKPETWST